MDRASISLGVEEAFHHVPGGSNVLYLDGHVDFHKLGPGSPVSPEVLWIPECLRLGME